MEEEVEAGSTSSTVEARIRVAKDGRASSKCYRVPKNHMTGGFGAEPGVWREQIACSELEPVERCYRAPMH